MRTKIWRNYFQNSTLGHFVWLVHETDSVSTYELENDPEGYLPTLDGGYILSPWCVQYWKEENAGNLYWENADRYTEVILIDPENGPSFLSTKE
jgi:hypothetical protein